MRLAVCLERDGRCIIDEKVLDGTKFPQPGCDMSIDISSEVLFCILTYILFQTTHLFLRLIDGF
jgi:hypothetical protein